MALADVNATQWTRIRDLADLLLDSPPDRWEEIARETLPADENLRQMALELARSFDDSPDFLGLPSFPKIDRPADEKVLGPGEFVGPYRIESEIGSGGMGRVYRASRADGAYSRTVAIKLVRLPGASALERFRAERRILAGLEHENIARLHDAGATADGSLHFVMEYVEGLPIDVYCRNLDHRSIARLFRTVAAAIGYAHSKGVVHRDLKPGNILVDAAGSPKLLDFGIASLKSAPAQAAMGVTPAFASPEQLDGRPVNESTDVYSLGAMLTDACTASRQPAHVDLAAIAAKAMADDPNARYHSGAELAADLGRYLSLHPVEARPSTWSYRFVRFAQRNRMAMALSAGLLVALAAGAVGIEWQRHRERLELQATSGIVRDILAEETRLSGLAGTTEIRHSLLQKAFDRLRAVVPEDARDPELAAELAEAYLRIGLVLGMPGSPSLGDYAGAEASVHRGRVLAEELVRRWPQDEHGREVLATGLSFEQTLLGWRGDDLNCIRLGERAQTYFHDLHAFTPELSIALIKNEEMLARCYAHHGQLDDAIQTARRWVAREEHSPTSSPALRTGYGRLARTLFEAGRDEEGRATYRKSLERYRSAYRSTPTHSLQIEFAQELISAAGARTRACSDPLDRGDIQESLGLATQAYSTDATNITALALVADAQRCDAMNLTAGGDPHGALNMLAKNRAVLESNDVGASAVRKRLAQNWLETSTAAQHAGDLALAAQAADAARLALSKGQSEAADGPIQSEAWSQTAQVLAREGKAAEAADAWRRQLQEMRRYAKDIPGRNTSLELARTLHSVGMNLLPGFRAEALADLQEGSQLYDSVPYPLVTEAAQARRDWQNAAH